MRRLGSARLRIFTVPIEGGGGEMKENDPGLSNSYLIDQHADYAQAENYARRPSQVGRLTPG